MTGKLLSRLAVLFASVWMSVSVMAAQVGEVQVVASSGKIAQDRLEVLVKHMIGTRVGTEFSPNVVSEDIKQLVKSGNFEDVQTKFEQMDDGRIRVIFTVAPKPMVVKISFQGNTEYTEKSLRRLAKHETGIPLDENQLSKDRIEILNRYRNAGFYGTEVQTIRTQAEDANGVEVTFVIKEEVRHKLKKVYFQGNTAFTEKELRREIYTKRQWWRYILRFGNYYNPELKMLDQDKLQELYHSKGYLDFAVTDVKTNLVDDDKWVEVTYVLQEGTPYTITNISIEGQKKFTEQELLNRTTLKPGQIFDGTKQKTDISLMKAEYERLGYLELQFWSTEDKNSSDHTVAITYHVNEGEPSNVRRIDIVGNERTQERVVRRELAISPGDKSDNSKIRISRNRLMNLGYFDKVDILPVATDDPALRDLRIELGEKPTGTLSLGAGFSTEDNAIAFVEFGETNFDLGRLLRGEWPPKGAGQRLRTRIQVGSSTSNISINLTEPWFLDRRLELSTDIFLHNRFEDEYDQRNIGFGQTLSWPVAFRIPGTEHTENWRVGVGYRIEYIRISDVDKHKEESAMEKGDFVPDHCIADDEGSEWANRFLLRLSRDTRDSFRFPTRGSQITAQTEFVTTALGAYENYGRFNFEVTKYTPIFRDFILKLNADYATSTSSDDIHIFDRYFAGGIGTVRGFKRRDVAPRDRFDDPLGGNSMVTATAELIKPVSDIMFVSVFLDAGNVWWDDFECDLGDLNYSVGFGVQFRAIPISIYYGVPIETTYDHLDGRSGRIHFNIGITY
ncbi:MAG: outer membrane protein assembly factor BamA [Victivallales bacterium]|nr:outer membrane protein assembly factor BamA [Victivallales bacterium]